MLLIIFGFKKRLYKVIYFLFKFDHSIKIHNIFINQLLVKNGKPDNTKFTYPFLNMMSMGDPFGQSLPMSYDPSFYILADQQMVVKKETPKVEEGTSPGYVLQEPAQQVPKLEFSIKQANNQKRKKNIKKRNDDDYKPYKGGKIVKGLVKQKQDRNLIPNTVHHLLAFVQKQFKSMYLVQKIFKGINKNPKYTVVRYYNYHKMLRAKVNNYVNQQAMKIITGIGSLEYTEYDEREQAFYCCVSRILIKKFLKLEAVLMILLSKKVKKENIIDHLSVQRYLYENMRTVDSI